MQVRTLRLDGLKWIFPAVFTDERGFFYESFKQPLFEAMGLPSFLQDNVSFSKKGVIRALHFQRKPGQAKLVSCLQGKIFDVAVDIRSGSPTFGQWEGVILDDETRAHLYIPVGFAHGFAVLSETALVQYKVSALYDPAEEKSIRWNDPAIGIEWPIQNPLLAPRDAVSPFLNEVVFA